VLLVTRGLAASRERARAMILAGNVGVPGRPRIKAGDLVPDDTDVVVAAPDHPYVSRGGLKLAHALETFAVDVSGKEALDVGASTGGFTDALLERGARVVVALDVGRGQLAWKLRTDPRVLVVEGVNARTLTAVDLPAGHTAFDVVTIDVSFISLRLVLPAVAALLRDHGDVIALVKPQFEAGREAVGKGGIVRDPAVHARVIDDVTRSATAIGLQRLGLTPSPIAGAEGNREFLMHLRKVRPPDDASRPPAGDNAPAVP
jgi:23S rRNA (cytidine1920-2'-O)/16S rRNA (cytidine1409-2'-O)-methyltransferase